MGAPEKAGRQVANGMRRIPLRSATVLAARGGARAGGDTTSVILIWPRAENTRRPGEGRPCAIIAAADLGCSTSGGAFKGKR